MSRNIYTRVWSVISLICVFGSLLALFISLSSPAHVTAPSANIPPIYPYTEKIQALYDSGSTFDCRLHSRLTGESKSCVVEISAHTAQTGTYEVTLAATPFLFFDHGVEMAAHYFNNDRTSRPSISYSLTEQSTEGPFADPELVRLAEHIFFLQFLHYREFRDYDFEIVRTKVASSCKILLYDPTGTPSTVRLEIITGPQIEEIQKVVIETENYTFAMFPKKTELSR